MGTLATKNTKGQEVLAQEQFNKLQNFAKEHWGFDIHPNKKNLVENRLSSLCRKNKFSSPSEVLESLFKTDSKDLQILVFDSLSTNLTSFFRDPEHFDFFEKEILETFRKSKGLSKLRLWSAGCSIGCEPYSLAIQCKESLSASQLSKIYLLGTDYSVSVLAKAKEAVFPKETVQKIQKDLLHRHFLKGVGKAEGKVKLKNEIQALVHFRLLNLMESLPGMEPFDAIFCRNVMIYFDENTQASLIKRLTEQLKPGGWLFVGSAESLPRISSNLISVRPSIFQKQGGNS